MAPPYHDKNWYCSGKLLRLVTNNYLKSISLSFSHNCIWPTFCCIRLTDAEAGLYRTFFDPLCHRPTCGRNGDDNSPCKFLVCLPSVGYWRHTSLSLGDNDVWFTQSEEPHWLQNSNRKDKDYSAALSIFFTLVGAIFRRNIIVHCTYRPWHTIVRQPRHVGYMNPQWSGRSLV